MNPTVPILTKAQHALREWIYRAHPTAWVNVDVRPRVNGRTVAALRTAGIIEVKKEGPRHERFCRLTPAGLEMSRRLAGT